MTDNTTKNIAIIGGLAVATLSIYLFYDKYSEHRQQQQAADESQKIGRNGATTIASKLIAAFDPYSYWGGTDEQGVYDALREMNNRKIAMRDVEISYSKLTKGQIFQVDLRDELFDNEYSIALSIIEENAKILRPTSTTLPPNEVFQQVAQAKKEQKIAYANVSTTVFKVIENSIIPFANVQKSKFLGIATGRKANNLIELQTKINNVLYTFWAKEGDVLFGSFQGNYKDAVTTREFVNNY